MDLTKGLKITGSGSLNILSSILDFQKFLTSKSSVILGVTPEDSSLRGKKNLAELRVESHCVFRENFLI